MSVLKVLLAEAQQDKPIIIWEDSGKALPKISNINVGQVKKVKDSHSCIALLPYQRRSH